MCSLSRISSCKLLAVSAFFLAVAACGRNPQAFVDRGRKEFDAGKFARAELDYLHAAQMDARRVDAWYGAALAQFRQKKLADAYANITHASELAPQRDDIAVSTADIEIAAYLEDPTHPAILYSQAESTAAALLRKDPNSWDGLRLTGLVAMLDRHYPDAIASLRKADRLNPGSSQIVQPLMEALIQNGQGAEAENMGRAYLARDPHFPAVYDTLYRWYVAGGNQAAAEQLLKDKIAANPSVQDDRLQLAGLYARQRKTERMKAALAPLVADRKTFPDGIMAAANFCAANGLPNDALAYLSAGISSGGNKIKYQQRAAELLADNGAMDKALSVLNEILHADPGNADARALRAGIEVETNDPAQIEAAFNELPQLLKDRPNDAILHYYLGRANVQRGDTEAALAQFEEAMRQNPGLVQARVQAANVSMQRGDFQRATQYGSDVVALTRGDAAARLLHASGLIGLGSFDQAQREITAVEQQYPAALEPKLQEAALRLAQKRYSDAETIYRSLHSASPKDIRPLEGLAQTLEVQNRYDAAVDMLKQEKAKAPSPQIDALLADVALRGNQLDLAVQAYSQIATANPAAPFPHLRLGDAYMRKGDLNSAIGEFQKAKSLSPRDPLANAMLALALHNADRGEEALRAYRETLTLESGNPLVANNLAYLMAENGGNLDEALKLAQSAARAQPGNEAIADTLGWIYLKKNLPDSAIQVLSNATQKDPRQAIYKYHLAMAFYQKGDKSAARQACEAALADKPGQSDARKIRDLLARVS